MASSLFAATLLATAATLASAQSGLQDTRTGNPSAATGLSFDQPTRSWSQWQPKPTYAYEDLPDQYMGEDRGAPLENGFQVSGAAINTSIYLTYMSNILTSPPPDYRTPRSPINPATTDVSKVKTPGT